jgi:hypothetical protein
MPVKAPQQMDVHSRLETLMAQTGARDRINIEKHLAVCDAESDPVHARLWRRLMVRLGELAPLPVRTAGPHIMQFFIADGKYRMQVFAMEDHCDGSIVLYLPNVIAKAVSEKLLVKNGVHFSPPGATGEILTLQQMDVRNPLDPPEYIKHMMGWNRKAVKLTLRVADPESPQVHVAERLCTLAATQWTSEG